MQSIKRTPECVEAWHVPSACLKHRQRVVSRCAAEQTLGPIDLVWSRKRAKGALGQQTRDFFHHVVGYDVVNTASAAAYFAEMCTNRETVCIASARLVCSCVTGYGQSCCTGY
jgi:hypothetical protein